MVWYGNPLVPQQMAELSELTFLQVVREAIGQLSDGQLAEQLHSYQIHLKVGPFSAVSRKMSGSLMYRN